MNARVAPPPEVKSHPDYSNGYFAGLNDEPSTGQSPEYLTGFENGKWARELFESQGFSQSGDSEFRVSFELGRRA